MAQREDDAAEQILRDAMVSANFGIDADEAAAAVHDMLLAFRAAAGQLREAGHRGKRVKCPACASTFEAPAGADVIARAAAHMAKGMDEVVRLSAFAQGRPDSRPGAGGSEILKLLTAEQVALVEGWIAEASARR